MNLLALLLAFFRLGVDDPQPDPDPDPDQQPELDLDPADPDPEPQDDPQVASREELQAAQRERDDAKKEAERYQRELAEARAAHRPAPRIDEEAAKEDARLADPNTPPLEKWQIQANRELRAGRSAAQTALMQAEDVRDQTAFSQLAMTEPALHKRYAAKVEEELGKIRAKGYNTSREMLYNQLLAKDMREGKFKKKAAPAAGGETTKVNRGKLPGVRSDVGSRGAATEREKRAKRLENVQI